MKKLISTIIAITFLLDSAGAGGACLPAASQDALRPMAQENSLELKKALPPARSSSSAVSEDFIDEEWQSSIPYTGPEALSLPPKGFIYLRNMDNEKIETVSKKHMMRWIRKKRIKRAEIIYDQLNTEGALWLTYPRGKRTHITQYTNHPSRRIRYQILNYKPDRTTLLLLKDNGDPLDDKSIRKAIVPGIGIKCHLPDRMEHDFWKELGDVIIYSVVDPRDRVCVPVDGGFSYWPFPGCRGMRIRYRMIDGEAVRTSFVILDKYNRPLRNSKLRYAADPGTDEIICHLPDKIRPELFKMLSKAVIYTRTDKQGKIIFGRTQDGENIHTFTNHKNKRVRFVVNGKGIDPATITLLDENDAPLTDGSYRYAAYVPEGGIVCHLPDRTSPKLLERLDGKEIYDRLSSQGTLKLNLAGDGKSRTEFSFSAHPNRRVKYRITNKKMDRTTFILLEEDGRELIDDTMRYAVDLKTGKIRCHLPQRLIGDWFKQLDNVEIRNDRLDNSGAMVFDYDKSGNQVKVRSFTTLKGRRPKISYRLNNGKVDRASIVILDDKGLPLDDGSIGYAVDLNTGLVKCHLPKCLTTEFLANLGPVEIEGSISSNGWSTLADQDVYKNRPHRKGRGSGRVLYRIYDNKIIATTLLSSSGRILAQEMVDSKLLSRSFPQNSLLEYISTKSGQRIITWQEFVEKIYKGHWDYNSKENGNGEKKLLLKQMLFELLHPKAYFYLGYELRPGAQMHLKSEVYFLWKDILKLSDEEIAQRLLRIVKHFGKFARPILQKDTPRGLVRLNPPRNEGQIPASFFNDIKEYERKMLAAGRKHAINTVFPAAAPETAQDPSRSASDAESVKTGSAHISTYTKMLALPYTGAEALPLLPEGYVYVRDLDKKNITQVSKRLVRKFIGLRRIKRAEVIYDRLAAGGGLTLRYGGRQVLVCQFTNHGSRMIRYQIIKGIPQRTTAILLDEKGNPLNTASVAIAADLRTGTIMCHLPDKITREFLKELGDAIIYDTLGSDGTMTIVTPAHPDRREHISFRKFPDNRIRFCMKNGELRRDTILLLDKYGMPLKDSRLRYAADPDPEIDNIMCHIPDSLYEGLLDQIKNALIYTRINSSGYLCFKQKNGKGYANYRYSSHAGKRVKFRLVNGGVDTTTVLLLDEGGKPIIDGSCRYALYPDSDVIKCHLPENAPASFLEKIKDFDIYDSLDSSGYLVSTPEAREKSYAAAIFRNHPNRRIKYRMNNGRIDKASIVLLDKDGKPLIDDDTRYAVDLKTQEIRCHFPGRLTGDWFRKLEDVEFRNFRLHGDGALGFGVDERGKGDRVCTFRRFKELKPKVCFMLKDGKVDKASIIILDERGLPLDDGVTQYAVSLDTGDVKCHLPEKVETGFLASLGNAEVVNDALDTHGVFRFANKIVYAGRHPGIKRLNGKFNYRISNGNVVAVTLFSDKGWILSQELVDKREVSKAFPDEKDVKYLVISDGQRIITYDEFITNIYQAFWDCQRKENGHGEKMRAVKQRLFELVNPRVYFYFGPDLLPRKQLFLKSLIYALWKDLLRMPEDEAKARMLKITKRFEKFAKPALIKQTNKGPARQESPTTVVHIASGFLMDIAKYERAMAAAGRRHCINPELPAAEDIKPARSSSDTFMDEKNISSVAERLWKKAIAGSAVWLGAKNSKEMAERLRSPERTVHSRFRHVMAELFAEEIKKHFPGIRNIRLIGDSVTNAEKEISHRSDIDIRIEADSAATRDAIYQYVSALNRVITKRFNDIALAGQDGIEKLFDIGHRVLLTSETREQGEAAAMMAEAYSPSVLLYEKESPASPRHAVPSTGYSIPSDEELILMGLPGKLETISDYYWATAYQRVERPVTRKSALIDLCGPGSLAAARKGQVILNNRVVAENGMVLDPQAFLRCLKDDDVYSIRMPDAAAPRAPARHSLQSAVAAAA